MSGLHLTYNSFSRLAFYWLLFSFLSGHALTYIFFRQVAPDLLSLPPEPIKTAAIKWGLFPNPPITAVVSRSKERETFGTRTWVSKVHNLVPISAVFGGKRHLCRFLRLLNGSKNRSNFNVVLLYYSIKSHSIGQMYLSVSPLAPLPWYLLKYHYEGVSHYCFVPFRRG